MFKNLSDFFYRQASGLNVLLFIAMQMIISAVILPKMQVRFDPGMNLGLMDLSFGFTPEEGYKILESYGEEGRKAYFFTEWAVDIIYPVIYSFAFTLLISFIFKRAFKPGQALYGLNFLPILTALGDFVENAAIMKMVAAFPERVDPVARIASAGGLFKWGFTGLTILLLLTGLIALLAKAFKK